MRRRVLFAPLAALFAAALVTLGLTPVASAAPSSGPTLTVSPSTGLSDGQSVTVTGSGFPNNTNIYVVECAAGTLNIAGCKVAGVQILTATDHAFTVTYQVAESFKTTDCTKDHCVIQANAGTTADAPRGTSSVLQFGEASPPTSTSGNETTTTTTTQTTTSTSTTSSSSTESSTPTSSSATSGSSSTESSPMTTSSQGSSSTGSTESTTTSSTPQETTAIEVQDASGSSPAITVSPSSGLSDGDTVTVSGSHYPANTQVYVVECAKNASGASGCNVGGVQVAQTDGSGSFTVSGFAVAQSFKDTDCTQTACVIQGNAGTTPDAPRGTSVALQFGAAGSSESSTSASTGGGNGGTSGTSPTMTIGASSGQLASTGTPAYAIAALGAILVLLGGGALWLSRQRSSRAHSSHAH